MKKIKIYAIVDKQTGEFAFDDTLDQYTMFETRKKAQEFIREWKNDMYDQSEIKDYRIVKLTEEV